MNTVRLVLSKAGRSAISQGVSEGEIRAHMVRGHFKVRRRQDGTAGIYWWSSHLRGRLDHGFVDKSYAVVDEN
jgi:hypothetical protein